MKPQPMHAPTVVPKIIGYDKQWTADTKIKKNLSLNTPGESCVRLYSATPGTFNLQIRGSEKGKPWYANAILPRAEVEKMILAVNNHQTLVEDLAICLHTLGDTMQNSFRIKVKRDLEQAISRAEKGA
jgi:hypothetical protein